MTDSEIRKLCEEVARIKVVYQDGYGYRVNKPQWDGGEVVMAADYDKLVAALREKIEAERKSQYALRIAFEFAASMPGWDRARRVEELCWEALDLPSAPEVKA